MRSIIAFTLLLIMCACLNAQEKKDTLKGKVSPVTITATRYPEYVQEIPYAVNIISERELINIRPFGLEEALSKVPGVLAQTRAGSQDIRLTIRGFGARGAGDRSNAGTSRGIRIMVDGFPETEPDGRTSFDMVETGFAENIEVMRSNASALWGNASGGVININTVPDFSQSFFNLQSSFATYKTEKFGFKTGIALTNTRISAGFMKTRTNGYREHSSADREVASVAFISKLAENSNLGVYLTAARSKFDIPGPLTDSQFVSNPEMANPIYKLQNERRFNRIGRIGTHFDYSFNDMHAVKVMAYISPKYLQRSERNSFRDFNRYHVGGSAMYLNSYQFTPSLQNKLAVGFDEAYQDGAILFYKLSASTERDTNLTDNKREGANTFGAFLQNELVINEMLSVIIGFRYDRVAYYSEKYSINTKVLYKSVLAQDKIFDRVTPKLGLSWKASEQINVYANMGGGVEVPAGNETDDINSTNLVNPLLDPITSTTYELGVKGMITNPGVKEIDYIGFDIAGYYINIKNDIVPYQSGKYFQTIGKSSRYGVEINAQVMALNSVKFTLAAAFSSNKYDSYTLNPFIAGVIAKYDGNKIAGVPDLTYNAGISYKPVFFNKITLSLSAQGVGKYYADDANTLEVPSYMILNGSLMYEDVVSFLNNTGVRLSLNAYNITDKKYASSAFINPISYYLAGKNNAMQPGYLEPGLPQNYAFAIAVMF